MLDFLTSGSFHFELYIRYASSCS